jgi:hypothetical protein
VHERFTQLGSHGRAHRLLRRHHLLEAGVEHEEVLVVDALGRRVEQRLVAAHAHQVDGLGDDAVAQIAHEVREHVRLEAVGQRLAAGEVAEALLELLAGGLALGLGRDALELRLVDRAEALDEHLRLLRDHAVAVAFPCGCGPRFAMLLRSFTVRFLGDFSPNASSSSELRRGVEEAIDCSPRIIGLRVLVGVLDLVLHEDTDADELG